MPFIARAIAQKPAARQQLDAIYADGRIIFKKMPDERAQVYNRYYRESDVLAEIACQKATALILTAFEEDDNGKLARSALEQLMKHGWPHLYAHVRFSGSQVPFEPIWRKLMENSAKAKRHELRNLPDRPPRMNATTKNLLDGDFPVLLFLTNMRGKTFGNQGDFFQHMFGVYAVEQDRLNRPEKPAALTGGHKELADALWQALEEKLRGVPGTLNEYFNTIAYLENPKKYLFKAGNFSGLPFHSLKHAPVSRKEMRGAIDAMAVSLPADTAVTNELKEDAAALFQQVLLLRSCAAEYEKLRAYILKYNRPEPKRKSKAAAQEKNLKLELAETRREKLLLEKSLAERQTELSELRLKLDKQELAARKEKAELAARLDSANQIASKLMASRQQETEPAPDLDQEAVEQISRLKVIVIGGRFDWQRRLREKYPNFSFIASEDVRYDLELLKAADAIVINWRNLSHSLFHRTVNHAGKFNKRLIYFGNSNENHLLDSLYRECILPEARGE